MNKITLIKPDDAHLHLRDGIFLNRTVADAAKRFARAIIMPNLKPPITQLNDLQDYRERILAAIPQGMNFEPLMTLYLTENMTPEIIHKNHELKWATAVKLYPAGVTTHSEFGVNNLEKMIPIFREMEACHLPLLIHGETNNISADIFDREKIFLKTLSMLIEKFPKLRIVLEHITTQEAVNFILSCDETVAATITAHHLLFNRNDLLAGGIKPHYYCLPILKRRLHQEALIEAAISGNPRFFLGTDSAPHSIFEKESACGCAGIYSAHAAIELYAEIFEKHSALKKLENFSSRYASRFYQLSETNELLTLVEEPWTVPDTLPFGNTSIVPLYAGQTLKWRLAENKRS